MPTTAAPKLQLFLARASGSVLLMSLIWIWLGEAYIKLLLHLASSLIPASVDLRQHGHDIQFLVQGTKEGSLRGGLHGNNYSWYWPLLNGLMMTYGIIPAISVILAVPSLIRRVRIPLIVLIIFTAFAAHLFGLCLIAEQIDSIFHRFTASRGSVEPNFSEFVTRTLAELHELGRTLNYIWLFIPSLIWLPLLLWQFWPRQAASTKRARDYR